MWAGFGLVVPYIGTWIETKPYIQKIQHGNVVPYIGTWIETNNGQAIFEGVLGRTLYRYVD